MRARQVQVVSLSAGMPSTISSRSITVRADIDRTVPPRPVNVDLSSSLGPHVWRRAGLQGLVAQPCFALAEGAVRAGETAGHRRKRPSGRECPNGDKPAARLAFGESAACGSIAELAEPSVTLLEAPPAGRKHERGQAAVRGGQHGEASVRPIEHPAGEAGVPASVRDALDRRNQGRDGGAQNRGAAYAAPPCRPVSAASPGPPPPHCRSWAIPSVRPERRRRFHPRRCTSARARSKRKPADGASRSTTSGDARGASLLLSENSSRRRRRPPRNRGRFHGRPVAPSRPPASLLQVAEQAPAAG
jgi:hypothetical protein